MTCEAPLSSSAFVFSAIATVAIALAVCISVNIDHVKEEQRNAADCALRGGEIVEVWRDNNPISICARVVPL